MSELIFENETLNQALEGHVPSYDESILLYDYSQNNTSELFQTADVLRKKHKGSNITFSKKAFFNVINLCSDTCSYCTYKATPNDASLSMLNKDSVQELAELSMKYRCVEALLVTGENPDSYPLAKRWLADMNYSSTMEYLIDMSEMLLDIGLFPHTNAGNLDYSELAKLSDTNASLGLMLESTSEELLKPGMAHHLAPSKKPSSRIRVLNDAGRLGIPMTTGILLGIGETPMDAIRSIYTIQKIHNRYQNIQEVIIQNFQPKPSTSMGSCNAAPFDYFKMIVSLCRVILPTMNIQIPPNLSPTSYDTFLNLGINDWGGISPFTPDHVNPEFSWPAINDVSEKCRLNNYTLQCRFPVYPEFLHMSSRRVQDATKRIADENDLVKSSFWR